MATIKSYTDLSQSKVLAMILQLESADYCWGIDVETLQYNNSPYPCACKDYTCKEYYIPCWSLAALLNVLPYPTLYQQRDGAWGLDVWVEQVKPYSVKNAICEVDACYEMILKLHKQNVL